MPPILRYEDYTIGWICAIQVEVVAARFMLDEKHDGAFPGKIGDENHYIPGTINGHNVVIAGLPKKTVGNVSAASLVPQMRQSFVNLRYGLMVGIGAGVPGHNLRPDIRLGDVVVAAPSDDSHDAQGVIGYELGKETVNGFVKKNTLYPTDRRLRAAFESIQAEAEFEGNYVFPKYLTAFQSRPTGKSFQHPGLENDELYRADETTFIERKPRDSPDPVVHYGLIASGDKLIKNAKLRDELRDEYGIICFEMEAAGLMNTLPVAVIRGICDYADSHKNDVWHYYAAATAAAFAKGLLYAIGADPSENPPIPHSEVPSAVLKLPEVRKGTEFGQSVDDVAVLAYLAQKVLRSVKNSFGDQGQLTREDAYMYRVLRRLRRELSTPDSFLNSAEDDLRQDIAGLGSGCMRVLMRTEDVLARHNSVSEEKKSSRRVWSKAKPLSTEMQKLAEIKRMLLAHTSAMTVCLDLCSSRGQGRVEKQLRNLAELKGIPEMTSKIAAKMTAKNGDGTVWTSYKDDDSAFWKRLRRGLVKNGFGSSVLDKHEGLIRDYVEELGRRGVFDQKPSGAVTDSSIFTTMDSIDSHEVETSNANAESSASTPSIPEDGLRYPDVVLSDGDQATIIEPEAEMDWPQPNSAEDDLRQDIAGLGSGCMRVLMRTEDVLARHNSVSEEKKSSRRVWSKAKPLSTEMQKLAEIKRMLLAHTSAMTVCLDLCSSRGQGRVEKQLRNLAELKGIPEMTSKIAAKMTAKNGDGTVWTSYKDDDSAFWKRLRRGLVKNGFGSSVLDKHEGLIRDYVEELGRRGVFDQKPSGAVTDSSIFTTMDSIDSHEVETSNANAESSASTPSIPEDGLRYPDVVLSDGDQATIIEPEAEMDWPQPELAEASSGVSRLEDPTEEAAILFKVVVESMINPALSVPPIIEVTKQFGGQTSNSVTPKPVMIEEVIDDDFLPAAHPNVGDLPKPVYVEEIVDEEFLPGAHPSIPDAIYWETIDQRVGDIPIALKNFLERQKSASRDRQTFWNAGKQLEQTRQKANREAGKTWAKYQVFDRVEENESDSDKDVTSEAYDEVPQGEDSREECRSKVPNYVFFSTKTLERYPDIHTREARPLTVRDAVGRKFTIPFHLCNTWEGIHDIITKAFKGVETLGPLVSEGYYDLICPDGDIILPKVWPHLVEPGWAVTMQLWPIPKSAVPMPSETHEPQQKSATYTDDGKSSSPIPSPIPLSYSETSAKADAETNAPPLSMPSSRPSQESEPASTPHNSSSKAEESTRKRNEARGTKSRKQKSSKFSPPRKGFFSSLGLGMPKPDIKKKTSKKTVSTLSSSTSQSKKT